MNESLQIQAGSLEQLARFAAAGYLYAIVDSVDALGIADKAEQLGANAVSLFCDSSEEALWAVSPFLFRIEQPTLEWIAETLWTEPWGVFAMSKSSMEEVREHLRKFLTVLLPDGERWFFRYYDPRILKVYLPACNEAELQVFYGPVRAFGIKTPEEQHLLIVQRAATPNLTGEAAEAAAIAIGNGHGLWRVRPEQYAALTEAAHREFLAKVTAHVTQFFPERCAELRGEGTARAIEAGIERATSYGISGERDVCRFLDLMFGFGDNFDTSAAFAWAEPILRDAGKAGSEKLDLIFAELMKISQQQESAVAGA